jgi:hypothetical protein
MAATYRTPTPPRRTDELAVAARLAAIDARLVELDRQLELLRETVAAGFGTFAGRAPIAPKAPPAAPRPGGSTSAPLLLEDGHEFIPADRDPLARYQPPPPAADDSRAADQLAAARAEIARHRPRPAGTEVTP